MNNYVPVSGSGSGSKCTLNKHTLTNRTLNNVKKNEVPRMTLSDRLKTAAPAKTPVLGRPQELSKATEEALVKCLEMCAEFNYPMGKKKLQNLVQSYCVEHQVKTRWDNDRPGKDWIKLFKKRWSHRVKVRRPTNIKRSRAKVSPKDLRDFMTRIEPSLEGIPRYNIFNYDESPIRDDPSAEEAFFPKNTRHCEKVQNHSKSSISVMFCVSAAGDMLPPMVVYKSGTGSVYPTWGEGGPEGAVFAANKSGYFDTDKYTKWFQEVGEKFNI